MMSEEEIAARVAYKLCGSFKVGERVKMREGTDYWNGLEGTITSADSNPFRVRVKFDKFVPELPNSTGLFGDINSFA